MYAISGLPCDRPPPIGGCWLIVDLRIVSWLDEWVIPGPIVDPLAGCEPPCTAGGAMDIRAAGARRRAFFLTVEEGTGSPEGTALPKGPSCMSVVRRRASIVTRSGSVLAEFVRRDCKNLAGWPSRRRRGQRFVDRTRALAWTRAVHAPVFFRD